MTSRRVRLAQQSGTFLAGALDGWDLLDVVVYHCAAPPSPPPDSPAAPAAEPPWAESGGALAVMQI